MKYIYDNYKEFLLQHSTIVINFAKINTQIRNSIVFINHEKFIDIAIQNKNIIAIITSYDIFEKCREKLKFKYVIKSHNPKKDFYEFYNLWLKKENSKKKFTRISQNSFIHSSAFVSEYNVVIEDNVIIHPHAVILEGVTIKKNSIIGPNTTVGYEGFEFMKIDDKNMPIKHNGYVVIDENVEIQANSVVDRGVYGETTYIGKYTKIDNQVHIGHNIKIGSNTLITANTVIGGSAIIGDNVFIGLGTSISNRVYIGNNAKVNIGSTVVSNVKDNETVSGYFAKEHNKYMQEKLMLMRLIRNHMKNNFKLNEKDKK